MIVSEPEAILCPDFLKKAPLSMEKVNGEPRESHSRGEEHGMEQLVVRRSDGPASCMPTLATVETMCSG